MASQSLYRTHRPATFADVVGQDSIVSTLEEQIRSGTISHAYLFAGSRGLGKTSIARIFARELGTTDADIYEIDAASHNSVEHIRSLTEGVHTLPFSSPYKVYILDEAHMLSKAAWNAFLKTLEEPPPHVVFILATTERDRVPETVESRCQVFTFTKPKPADISTLLERVAKVEGFTIEPGAISLLELMADGSYRDALSVLSRLRAATTENMITREIAEKVLGAPSHSLVSGFITSVAENSPQIALRHLQTVADQGGDMKVFANLAITHARQSLLAKYAPELVKGITDISVSVTPQILVSLLTAYERMGYSPVPQLALELMVYELCEAEDGKE